MEKFYIVTNEKFLKEIDIYRKHEEERRTLVNIFLKIKVFLVRNITLTETVL